MQIIFLATSLPALLPSTHAHYSYTPATLTYFQILLKLLFLDLFIYLFPLPPPFLLFPCYLSLEVWLK